MGQFTAKTLRALLRGRLHSESLHITFIDDGQRRTGVAINMGSLITAKVNGVLIEDIHPVTVVRVEIV